MVWLLFMERIAIQCKEKPAKYMMLSPNEAETALKDICNNISGISFTIKRIEITKPPRLTGNKVVDSRYVVGFSIRANTPNTKENLGLISRAQKRILEAVSRNKKALIKDSSAFFDRVTEKDKPIALSKDFGELDYAREANADGSQTIWWIQGQVKSGVLDCSKVEKDKLKSSRISGKVRGIHRNHANRDTGRVRIIT